MFWLILKLPCSVALAISGVSETVWSFAQRHSLPVKIDFPEARDLSLWPNTSVFAL